MWLLFEQWDFTFVTVYHCKQLFVFVCLDNCAVIPGPQEYTSYIICIHYTHVSVMMLAHWSLCQLSPYHLNCWHIKNAASAQLPCLQHKYQSNPSPTSPHDCIQPLSLESNLPDITEISSSCLIPGTNISSHFTPSIGAFSSMWNGTFVLLPASMLHCRSCK